MIRLCAHVEGSTEEQFINEVLAPHLVDFDVLVTARMIGSARFRSHRGGIKGWRTVRKEIVNQLREDRESIATTMVDFYGLPKTGPKAWPGRYDAGEKRFQDRAKLVQSAMAKDLRYEMGAGFNDNRFVPYLMMHEFEALLFSDCAKFSIAIERPNIQTQLQDIRDQFSNPEHINDSKETAPSKRILRLVEGYQKVLMGMRGVRVIGLEKIRAECPHFSNWLGRLESLSENV
ncbi:MAG: DUF4276 family protein [Gammaproteobacteria bacterium]|nr:DUF4276 family protein [Gammaproteobacteria bacterium]MYA65819.1 DUF4276 family protein [Gammaproteobacteria bacterium]MYH47456.1 DUF4276 family protein [Gammaproteobacteria bacterium]MYL12360.1 DUF4276 family protein [Gammaproteobacteria bacterium]